MPLQESGEMYLETIYILCQNSNCVRSINVCDYMGFSKPSVSRAVNLLKSSGYLTVGIDGCLNLTNEGLCLAKKIYERHTLLTRFFVELGVSKSTASDDACKIEHYLSDETISIIKRNIGK